MSNAPLPASSASKRSSLAGFRRPRLRVADLGDHQRRRRAALKKRRTELANLQDRLLNP